MPVHEPDCPPARSLMLRSTIGEFAVEHSAPLTIDVAAGTPRPRALHAVFDGTLGAGVGVLGAAGLLAAAARGGQQHAATTSIPKHGDPHGQRLIVSLVVTLNCRMFA